MKKTSIEKFVRVSCPAIISELLGQLTSTSGTLFKNQEHQLPIRIFHDCQAILEMPFTSKVASNEVFLAACIENPKEKLSVDFDAVAKLFGLSKGGAQ